LLCRIDVSGEVMFVQSDMAAVAEEATELLNSANEGPERRAVLRLQALATHGARSHCPRRTGSMGADRLGEQITEQRRTVVARSLPGVLPATHGRTR